MISQLLSYALSNSASSALYNGALMPNQVARIPNTGINQLTLRTSLQLSDIAPESSSGKFGFRAAAPTDECKSRNGNDYGCVPVPPPPPPPPPPPAQSPASTAQSLTPASTAAPTTPAPTAAAAEAAAAVGRGNFSNSSAAASSTTAATTAAEAAAAALTAGIAAMAGNNSNSSGSAGMAGNNSNSSGSAGDSKPKAPDGQEGGGGGFPIGGIAGVVAGGVVALSGLGYLATRKKRVHINDAKALEDIFKEKINACNSNPDSSISIAVAEAGFAYIGATGNRSFIGISDNTYDAFRTAKLAYDDKDNNDFTKTQNYNSTAINFAKEAVAYFARSITTPESTTALGGVVAGSVIVGTFNGGTLYLPQPINSQNNLPPQPVIPQNSDIVFVNAVGQNNPQNPIANRVQALENIVARHESRLNQLENRLDILDNKVLTLEHSSAIINGDIQSLDEKIRANPGNGELLTELELNKSKAQTRQSSIRIFNANPDLADYYNHLLSELTAVYIASKAVESEQITREKTEIYAKGSRYLSSACELIPVVGNLAGKIIGFAGTSADAYQNALNKDNLLKITKLTPSIAEFDKIAITIAIKLTTQNQEQIMQLNQARIPTNWKSCLTTAINEGVEKSMTQYLSRFKSQSALAGKKAANDVIQYLQQDNNAERLRDTYEQGWGQQLKRRESLVAERIIQNLTTNRDTSRPEGRDANTPANAMSPRNSGCIATMREACVVM